MFVHYAKGQSRMIFKELTITNFLSVGQAEIDLNGRGLVLIEGQNLDDPSALSNGAGKSSIVDALSWVLYGKTARGVSGDAVINRTAKKNCCVSIVIEDGRENYKVSRYRKDGEHANSLFVIHNDKDITKGTVAETQDVIDKIIGCGHEVFVATVYAGQEAMPDLPAMTDKQLKELIESVIGVEVLTKAYAKAKSLALECEKEQMTREFAYNSCVDRIANLKVRYEEMEKQSEGWRTQIEESIRDWESKKIGTEAAYIDIDKRLSGKSHEHNAAVERIEQIRLLIDNADNARKEYEALKNEESIQHAHVAYAKKNKEQKLEQATKQFEAIKNIESRVGTRCGECGTVYTKESLADAKKSAVDALNALIKEAEDLNAKVELAEKKLADATSKVQSYAMPDVSSLTNEMFYLNEVVNSYKEDFRERSRICADIEFIKSQIAERQDALRGASPFAETLDSINGEWFNAVEEERELKVKLEENAEKLNIYEGAVQIFGPQGVRQHVLDAITPILNDRTARYLNILSDGKLSAVWTTLATTKKGEIKEKFNIAVTNAVGGNSFESLSGGEKRKVRVACCLALQELVASRATKPIELFIADEVDHALDESGVERLIGVLNDKAQTCKTLLVISHNPLRNWIDNVITVTKENGQSKIS